MKTLNETDIFFDKDIINFLIEIGSTKSLQLNLASWINTATSSEMFNIVIRSNPNIITNYYQSAFTIPLENLYFLKEFCVNNQLKLRFEFFLDEVSKNFINQLNLIKSQNLAAVIDIQNFNLKDIKKGHRQNIEKCVSLNVKSKIYHQELPDNQIIKDFYESVVQARKNFGSNLSHPFSSFVSRAKLIEKGKAVLVVTEHEEKKSYVFALVGKYNNFYYDSGYNHLSHPYTAHYAQFCLIEYLKSLGATSYNLGKINNAKAKNDSLSKDEKVDYYKSGFVKQLTDIFVYDV